MPIRVVCSECDSSHQVADAFAGGVYRCPRCATLVDVPVLGQAGPASANTRAKAPPPGFFVRHRLEVMVMGGMVAGVLLLVGVILLVSSPGKTASEAAGRPAAMPKPSVVAAPALVAPVVEPPTWKFEPMAGQLTADQPNILGLPLAGDADCPGVQIVIDGAEELDPVRADLHRLVARGLTRPGVAYPYEVSIRYSNNTENPPLSVGPIKPGQMAEDRVFAALQAVKLAGLSNRFSMGRAWGACAAHAGAERAGNLVFVVGHEFYQSTVDGMRKQFKGWRPGRIDIVAVGVPQWLVALDGTLAKTAGEHGGRLWIVSHDEVRKAAAMP